MMIAHTGMSNIGKSFWAEKLQEEKNWVWIDCDKEIAQELKTELTPYPPEWTDTEKMAKWMGFPYDPHYSLTSKKYKEIETKVMKRIAERIRNLSPEERENQNLVIDTTGSFIYTDWEVQKDVIRLCDEVVHFVNSVENGTHVKENFIAYPKPLIFEEGTYSQQPGETQTEALLRAHSELMRRRELRYTEIRTIGIEPSYLKGIKTAEGYLSVLRRSILERDTHRYVEGQTDFRRKEF